jgi:hypothetical protein
MPKVNQQFVNRAHDIRSQYEADVERVRNNPQLSAVGKQQQLAAAWKTASTAMDGHKTTFNGTQTLTATDQRRRVFGADNVTGADAVSMRDAFDRAAQLQSGDEALALLRRAELTGDDHLARAVAATAFDKSAGGFIGAADWTAVVDAFTATRPDVAQSMQEIANAESSNVKDALDIAGYSYLGKPEELARVSDYQVDLLADGQDAWNPGVVA